MRREVFCNRTLNMKSIRAIGYDMDYTLIHYKVEEWERRVYEHLKAHFQAQGWPTGGLVFDPNRAIRGLTIDLETGNLLKTNQFGFVKKAMHGTRTLDFEEQRRIYARCIVDLAEPRWAFLNTLFSISEGCMYAQLVDLLDQKKIPATLGYADLYEHMRQAIDGIHVEGKLKAEIIANPERFVVLDPGTPLALLDQHYSGKKLMLVTNSEWHYTVAMMDYAFNRFLPKSPSGAQMTWRELFDVVVVGARKPQFFRGANAIFEVVSEDGLLKPVVGEMQPGRAYLGGSAQQIERHLGLSGDEILYVGDHMFGDVHASKSALRWRTALILRELEQELKDMARFRETEERIGSLMHEKERLEDEHSRLKVELQRREKKYAPPGQHNGASLDDAALHAKIASLREKLMKLDAEIGPLAKASMELSNPYWGPLMRSGNDKSFLAFHVERYADIYAPRVSNLLALTPFAYLRSPRGTLPHEEQH